MTFAGSFRSANARCISGAASVAAGWPGQRQEEYIQTAPTTIKPLVPPPDLVEGTALFLDLDGTLVDLVENPEAVFADADLRAVLDGLHARMAGRLAIVSGRSVAQLDRILGTLAGEILLAGSHGAEIRCDGIVERPERPVALDRATEAMRAFVAGHAGVLIEEKSFGTAFHYRRTPETGPEAETFARHLAQRLGLFVQPGKMMIELRSGGHDKGGAIRALMARAPLSGALPVFAGDDLTDESGFEAAAALGGYGVLVGAARPSAARFRLDDPRAVRAWLRGQGA